jgi:hypothetical protein
VAELMNLPVQHGETRLYQGLALLRGYLAEQGKIRPAAAGPRTKIARRES